MKTIINRNLKRAALAVTVSVFALGMAQKAHATTDTVSTIGHISASVGSALSIVETSPIKFGNLLVATPSHGDGTVVISTAGARTAVAGSDGLALLNGASNSVAGGDDAGSESAGYYAITGATAAANIYVSFSVASGGADALIDSNHPTNHVTLVGPNTDWFFVDTFTFNSSGSDSYGSYITASGGGAATVQVGAKLHTVTTAQNTGRAGAPTYGDGAYRGTFNIMASY